MEITCNVLSLQDNLIGMAWLVLISFLLYGVWKISINYLSGNDI